MSTKTLVNNVINTAIDQAVATTPAPELARQKTLNQLDTGMQGAAVDLLAKGYGLALESVRQFTISGVRLKVESVEAEIAKAKLSVERLSLR